MRRFCESRTLESHLEDLWISLLSLSGGDASENIISWTRLLGCSCCQKLGNQPDVLSLMWNICFEDPWCLNYRLQGKNKMFALNFVPHTQLKHNIFQLNKMKYFDLLKTQFQIILSEVMISFLEMQCVMLFRALYLDHLSAVSSASLTWKSQDNMYLRNFPLTDKLKYSRLWSLRLIKNSFACIYNLQHPMSLKIFDTNICKFWNFCNFFHLPGFNSKIVDASDYIEI